MSNPDALWEMQLYYRDDAIRGSEKLRRALIRMINPNAQFGRLPRRPVKAPPRGKARPKPDPFAPIIASIKDATARYYGIDPQSLVRHSRKRRFVEPRQVAMALAHSRGMSLPRIGREFDRDHTTVLHACRKVAGDPRFDGDVAAIREALAA